MSLNVLPAPEVPSIGKCELVEALCSGEVKTKESQVRVADVLFEKLEESDNKSGLGAMFVLSVFDSVIQKGSEEKLLSFSAFPILLLKILKNTPKLGVPILRYFLKKGYEKSLLSLSGIGSLLKQIKQDHKKIFGVLNESVMRNTFTKLNLG